MVDLSIKDTKATGGGCGCGGCGCGGDEQAQPSGRAGDQGDRTG